MSQVRETRKATIETILKQLEYFTKGHKAMQTMLFNLKWLFLVPFSSLVLLLFLNNVIVLMTRSHLSVAQASSSFK